MNAPTAFMVRPLDPVYFGPPSAQSAGEVRHARSLFPPPPSTFQGIVRSQLLRGAQPALNLSDLSEVAHQERARLVGSPDALPAGWQIEGPFPATGATSENNVAVPWFPTPRHLLRSSNPDDPVRAHPVRTGHANSVLPDGTADLYVGAPEHDESQALDGWVSVTNLLWGLAGEGQWNPKGHGPLPPFVRRERRTGVAIDGGSGTAQHGMLYSLEELRFGPGSGLAAWMTADLDSRLSMRALQTGVGAIGRGGRLAAFEALDSTHAAWLQLRSGAHLPDESPDGAEFWLVALTPAQLADPLCPELHVAIPSGVKVEVIGACLGPPLTLGGYSMVTRNARPNRVYVPAGSAWLIQLSGGSVEQRRSALQTLNGSHALGPRPEAQFGFGQTLIGIAPQPIRQRGGR